MATLKSLPIITGLSGNQLCLIFQYPFIKFSDVLPNITINVGILKDDQRLAATLLYSIKPSQGQQEIKIETVSMLKCIKNTDYWTVEVIGFIEKTDKFVALAKYNPQTRKGFIRIKRPLKFSDR